MDIKERLKNWRRSVLHSMKIQIREILGIRPKSLNKYYLDYRRVFYGKYRKVQKGLFLKKVENSKIIFLADYHTLPQAQKFQLEILKFLKRKNKDIILYLEPYSVSDQNILDDFLKGNINEEYFLHKIKYKKKWGFSWENYKEILNFSKEENIKIFGINMKEEASCEERDAFAGDFISKKIKENEDKVHIIIIGDLHLAPDHLPEKVLQNLNKKIRYTIVHQNSETIFLKEMEKGKEKKLDFIQINPFSFCVFNAPPWVKNQSFLIFLLKSKLLNIEEKNLDDHGANLLTRLGVFFGKKWGGDIEIKTFEELDFLPEILNLKEAHHFFYLLQENYPFTLPKENLIYIPFPDLLRFVEELAHYVFYIEGKWEDEHIYKENYFLHRIYYYAFGYFSSKLLFEERHTNTINQLKNILKAESDERAEKKLKRLKTAVPFIIKIYKKLGKIEKIKKYDILMDEKLCFAISRRVGYLLGEKWFNKFKKGTLSCKEILKNIPNPKIENPYFMC